MEIRYFAGAADAAGLESQTIDASGHSVREIVVIVSAGNDRLGAVLEASSLLADGVRVTSPEHPLDQVSQLDVLPPFAGG
ncbi:MAG: MoaD/ThiS family protein [Ruaniaceae bacterium]|nr:MoaD/ThiS family protein [Ruaniaceae bacterium]